MNAPQVELVVARFQESVNWLRRVPSAIRVHLYDKSGEAVSGRNMLPNMGREAHTYLHHIVARYDELPDVTVFAQGHPFDHAPDLHKRLRALASGAERVEAFRWFGFLVDCDDATGSRLFQRWSKNPEARPLPMEVFWREVFGDEAMPELFCFFGGAQFAVTRDCVRRRSRRFYERALGVAEALPDAAHCFERTWDRIFQENGIPEALRGRPLPIFLKPIRAELAARAPCILH